MIFIACPCVQAQFELEGGAFNVLDRRLAGASPAVSNAGVVTAITVRAGGQGYLTVPTVTIAAPQAGGSTATAQATISNGQVTSVVVISGGSGYIKGNPPEVIIAPANTPLNPPITNVQFAGMAVTSATSEVITTGTIEDGRYPRSTGMVNGLIITQLALTGSTFGLPFASGVPRYFMGDVIEPPQIGSDGVPLVNNNYWRPWPVQPGETFDSVNLSHTVSGLTQPLLPEDSVAVVESSTSSSEVTVLEVPSTLTSGATLLGREVQRINGNKVILSGSSNANISSNTITSFKPYQPYYYSRHAGKVFATQTGRITVTWVSAVPDTSAGESIPTYKFRKETFGVSSASQVPPRVIYWTEKTFDGPRVTIPTGRIVRVNPIYNSFVPGQAEEYAPVGGSVNPNPSGLAPSETRTLWFDTASGMSSLRAYNVEGRVFVEYLGDEDGRDAGVHEFLGADVVEIKRSAAIETLETLLGEQLRPRSGLEEPGDAQMEPILKSDSVLNGERLYGTYIRPDGVLNYFAERENLNPDNLVLYWLAKFDASLHVTNEVGINGLDIRWPVYKRNYLQRWPIGLADYVPVNVASTGNDLTTSPKFEATSLPSIVYQDDPAELEAEIDEATQRLLVQFTASSPDKINRSLLKFRSAAGAQYIRLWIESEDALGSPAIADDPATPDIDESRDPTYSINDLDGDGLRDWSASTAPNAPTGEVTSATVGSRIDAPAGYATGGHISGGHCYSKIAYIDPLGGAGFSGGAKGAIIPVNALSGENQLTVWWFREITFDEKTEIDPFYVPAISATYDVNWPDLPQELVIASLKGLENPGLTSVQASGSIYRQPDPALPGYNPNEEHAVLLSGNVYAMRDDLNVADSSEPYVLLQYTDAVDSRPAMLISKVVRSNIQYPLVYDKIAGSPMTPPMPLAFLPLPVLPDGSVRNTEIDLNLDALPLISGAVLASDIEDNYNGFTFVDRKRMHWLFRGPHLGEDDSAAQPTSFGMKFYYYQMAEFDFPSLALDAQPAIGSIQPFIADDGTGDSITLTYLPKWPDDSSLQVQEIVPELATGETLATAKASYTQGALPQIMGQTSAQVIYQQSMAAGGDITPSVILHDPLRAKTSLMSDHSLDELPTSILTTNYAGQTYFQKLAPDLQQRFYFDGNLGDAGGLVLQGEFVEEIVGEDYFHLNLLSSSDITALKSLCPDIDPDKAKWDGAIDELKTQLETFSEDPGVPGSYIVDVAKDDRVIGVDELADIRDPDTAVVNYALSSTGNGTGYVTLVFGNGEAFTESGDPVTMEIIKVVPDLYPGDLKVLLSSNPLDEKVTIRHSGDYGARPENFEFRYRYAFNDSGGQAPILPVDNSEPSSAWQDPDNAPFSLGGSILVGVDPTAALNSPAVLMGDVNFTMSYRLKVSGQAIGMGWSDWTPPALVEGWIKRVLAKITPFNQRMTDLYGNAIDTDVSLVTQAGTRWEGNIALNLENINDAGLIEIYETVLNRGKDFTIDSSLDTASTNNALLLAAGYLNDLYTILGNEAFADAANPTISIDDKDSVTEVNTSRFSFEGQVASSLDEELSLLRGRDDFVAPGTDLAPAYNRLWWNYTRGIDGGEVLYAVNYNIIETEGSSTADGVVDAADAQRMFPQGHGDAYGHYLTALKGYYKLLTHPYFTWIPSAETVTVLGVPVSVDYKDERKFSQASVNVARTAQEVMALTYRQSYQDDPAAGWSHFRDGKVNPRTQVARHQGLDETASRSAQGAFFHWIAGNAMLPDVDGNPDHSGVQIVDRTTVPELNELPILALSYQTTMDSANGRLNPLGLSPGAIAFDLDPNWNNSQGQVLAGSNRGAGHYKQISARALRALNNAAGSFNQAATMTRLLRNQENQISDHRTAILDQEYALLQELLDIYGSPYAGDVGPGKTYPQGYEDPDFYRWNIIDRPLDWIDTASPKTVTYRFSPQVYPTFSGETKDGIDEIIQFYETDTVEKTFQVTPDQWAQFSDVVGPGTALGQRPYSGALQRALVEAQLAQISLLDTNDDLLDLKTRFDREKDVFNALVAMHADQQETTDTVREGIFSLQTAAVLSEGLAAIADEASETLAEIAGATSEAMPLAVGTANDATSTGRSAILVSSSALQTALRISALDLLVTKEHLLVAADDLELSKESTLMSLGFDQEQMQAIYEFEQTFRELIGMYTRLTEQATEYQLATEKIRNLIVTGETIRLRRETLRQRAAALINGYRTKDLTFRTFRNEALEQYRNLFDLAARYSYLAAKSYDYETGLLGSEKGQSVINRLVASRSLGDLSGGEPQATTSTLGDAGLAGTMAQLNADFSVAEGRLGINNPDSNGTLISLRQELFRLLRSSTTSEDDKAWQQTLEQHMVSNLMSDPDVASQCRNLRKVDGSAVPGIVIPFGSTIEHGKNFFGLPTAGGDHLFSASNFATKIYSVGVMFEGYVGMDPFAHLNLGADSADTNDPNVLSATPYVYLIPCGVDKMMAPPLGDTGEIRSWKVVDQALPLPYNLGASDFNTTQFFGANDTLSEEPWVVRQHQAFRAVDDPAFFYGLQPAEFGSSRLIGRSVWNTQWKLVIPAYGLLNDEQTGLNRFAAGVDDIKLFLRTYSNAGN